MNHFYNVVKLLRDRLQQNELVNRVVFARTEEKDLFKKSVYPLAHIHPIEIPSSNSQIRKYTFAIGVFEQRDINKENEGTSFEGDDDVIDNLNVCDVILNDLITYLSIGDIGDYELDNVSSTQPILLQDVNLLDGMVVTITITVPNNEISIC